MINPLRPKFTDYAGNELYSGLTVWEFRNEFYQMNDEEALADLLEALQNYYGIDKYTQRVIEAAQDNRNAQYEAIPDFAFDDVVEQVEVKNLLEGY
ncbi:hypothetical protein [Secundilactobacillus kimchicus]|uniref:hypothetical protein n=1 Tax=Secundilactobacillus kimchicus TaxID=528209 RepID=UPI0024A87CB6|nr:hypothetical protein [Secundilactobacillus kimchicus]